jgi:hypothetical protein
MSEHDISLKAVYDLRVNESDRPIRYRIAAYQRGYRWTRQQVMQLLEDIRDFTRRENPQPDDFYCLQPLVLKPNEGGTYEVVDGQQRLTTLLLILRHFNDRLAKRYQHKLYMLEYETRADLLDFLENPSDQRAAANIDFFHIAQAAKTIEAWFAERESDVEEIKSAFLKKAKVIWFLLPAGENPVEAFTRLNVGKIPLTNGELIRALFLRRTKGDQAEALRLRIAYEWDLLEKGLQRNDFWHFLSNDTEQRGNRIGFLFDLVARAEGMMESPDTYATFYHYSEKLNAKDSDPEKEWLTVKKTFMLLEEWFEDRCLYHLVGFLIWKDRDVNDLSRLATGSTKKEFKEKLRALIFSLTVGSDDLATLDPDEFDERITDRVDLLEYGRDSQHIRSLLLLFNLATLLQNSESNMRFQFESFKTARWDIEHVRSVAPDQPGGRAGRIEWLQRCLGYFHSTGEAPELRAEIQQFIELPAIQATDTAFEDLYEKVLREFHETDGEADHSIANLVLLDYATNRSYKNAPFAVKRHRVLSLDRDGIFVPLCTRNVFLKSYNARVDHVMFWTQADRNGYRQAMIDVLSTFFQGEWIDE